MYAIGPLSVLSVSLSVTLVYCGQTLGWIRMPLGMEVKAVPLPNFRPISIVAKRWGGQNGTWYRGMSQPTGFCVRWGPSPLPKRGRSPSNFRPMFIVVKRLDGSRWHLAWRCMGLNGPGHIVLDGDQFPFPKMGQCPPNFQPILLWPNGWIHQDAT